jgi:hypothetical protein
LIRRVQVPFATVNGLVVSNSRMGKIRPRYNAAPSQELLVMISRAAFSIHGGGTLNATQRDIKRECPLQSEALGTTRPYGFSWVMFTPAQVEEITEIGRGAASCRSTKGTLASTPSNVATVGLWSRSR